MLNDGRVAARLPVRDLKMARAFYAEKLGLEPAEERAGGLLYRCGGCEFALFESAGTASGTHTQMGWTVDDIGIAEIPGNYPSKGRSERAVWFRDLDGNVLGLGEAVR